jgi:prephenate dehydrogenase
MRNAGFKKVCIIGVGMLGGSLGIAIRKKGIALEVAGVGRNKIKLNKARQKGAIDWGTVNLARGVEGADLVIIAAPVQIIIEYVHAMAPFLKSGCLITDVGSTKREVVFEAERFLPVDVHFAGGHPLAGAEKSGVRHASAELFRGCTCILTRTEKTDSLAIKRLKYLWKKLGAKVVVMSPAEHDRIAASVSHLPHIAACSLVSMIKNNYARFVSSGFRDTTRIAAGDPVMWRDICLTNRGPVLNELNRYTLALNKIKVMLKRQDSRGLEAWFRKVKSKREGL